jgi:hypothetical protein
MFLEKAGANFGPSLKLQSKLGTLLQATTFGATDSSSSSIQKKSRISPGAPKYGSPAAAPQDPRPEADSRTDPPAPLCHSLAVRDLPPGYAGNSRQTFSLLCSLEPGELLNLLSCGAVDRCPTL